MKKTNPKKILNAVMEALCPMPASGAANLSEERETGCSPCLQEEIFKRDIRAVPFLREKLRPLRMPPEKFSAGRIC